MRATVWFDGACSGNPGPMGAGAIVELAGRRHKVVMPPDGSGGARALEAMRHGTSNQAEYHGLIAGLRHALAMGAEAVAVRGDSQVVVRQLRGEYDVRAPGLRGLNLEARGLLAQFRAVDLGWVPREENAAADAAANEGLARVRAAR